MLFQLLNSVITRLGRYFFSTQTNQEPDFFTAIIFGATAGRFVGLVAVPQCLTGLILFSSAGFIVPLLSAAMLNDFKACGGIITLAAGLKVANIKSTRIINMLPALFLVMIFSYLWVKIFS